MTETLRFAEAVCAGHPDRLADTIADRIVALATSARPGRPRRRRGGAPPERRLRRRARGGRTGSERRASTEGEIVAIARQAFADAGYGDDALRTSSAPTRARSRSGPTSASARWTRTSAPSAT